MVTILDVLAEKGIDSCRPEHIEALHLANFSTSPIKELSITGPDGQTYCTDFGLPPDGCLRRGSGSVPGFIVVVGAPVGCPWFAGRSRYLKTRPDFPTFSKR